MDKVRQCFNRAALTYDQYSYPQQMIGDKLIASIYQNSPEYDLIADLGCGTGMITKKLVNTIIFKELYAVDISEKSIECAKNNLSHNNIFMFHDDINNLSRYEKNFHMIFSNMVLHWSENIIKSLRVIKRNLAMNGIVAFTVPITGTFNELNSASANHFYSLEEWIEFCNNADISIINRFEEKFVFVFNSWIQAIKSIKATGANFLFNRLHPGLSSTSRFHSKNFFKETVNEKFSLTYQVGYFIGKINGC